MRRSTQWANSNDFICFAVMCLDSGYNLRIFVSLYRRTRSSLYQTRSCFSLSKWDRLMCFPPTPYLHLRCANVHRSFPLSSRRSDKKSLLYFLDNFYLPAKYSVLSYCRFSVSSFRIFFQWKPMSSICSISSQKLSSSEHNQQESEAK